MSENVAITAKWFLKEGYSIAPCVHSKQSVTEYSSNIFASAKCVSLRECDSPGLNPAMTSQYVEMGMSHSLQYRHGEENTNSKHISISTSMHPDDLSPEALQTDRPTACKSKPLERDGPGTD